MQVNNLISTCFNAMINCCIVFECVCECMRVCVGVYVCECCGMGQVWLGNAALAALLFISLRNEFELFAIFFCLVT